MDSINGLTASGKIKQEFVGLILLPIVGNAAGEFPDLLTIGDLLNCRIEHVTAVTVSVKDKLNLSLGVAVGSSIVGVSLGCLCCH